jgi:hypothetical protein
MLRSILSLALILPLLGAAAEQCDIGDIGDFVVTYDVSVTNAAADPVTVTIRTPDASRNAVVAPGATVALTTFASGELAVTAGPPPGPEVARRLKEISDQVVSGFLAPIEALTLQQTIADAFRERIGPAALIADAGCATTLGPDKNGKGVDVHYTVGAGTESWVLEGPGC